MQSKAATVEEYLDELPEDRRAAISQVRDTILKSLPPGYEEVMQYGMIGYVVPHSLFPAGYHCNPKEPLPFAGLGSQKNHMALYLMCLYQNEALERWLREEYSRRGRKLDLGKGCLRFKKLEDLPLDVIGALIGRMPAEEYVRQYQESRAAAKPVKAKKK